MKSWYYLIMFFTVFSLSAVSTFACTCAPFEIDERYQSVHHVFVGEVSEVGDAFITFVNPNYTDLVY